MDFSFRMPAIGRFLPVAKDGNRLWIQPVDATDWLNRSAGFLFSGEKHVCAGDQLPPVGVTI
jgi:hypothetical protein